MSEVPCAGMNAMLNDLRRGFAKAMRDAPICIGSSPGMRTSARDNVRSRDNPRSEFANASWNTYVRWASAGGDYMRIYVPGRTTAGSHR